MVLFSSLSCGEKVPSAEVPQLSITSRQVDFTEAAATREVPIRANRECKVTSGASWCSAVVSGTTLKISVTENPGKEMRSTELTVTCAEKSEKVSIRQLGWGKQILVSPTSFSVPAVGGNYPLTVTANLDYEISSDVTWISQRPGTRAHEMVEYSHMLTIQANSGADTRKATITIRDKDGGSGYDATVSVIQEGFSDYSSQGAPDIAEDIKVPVASAEASSFQSGENIDKSCDGNYSTLYHSAYNNSAPGYFPITLTYRFAESTRVDYLVYHPRTTANPNGNFKETEILYKLKDGDWTTCTTRDFGGSGSPSKVEFSPALEDVEGIRFIVRSGAGDGQGFAACAEMEFYARNPDTFDPLTLFRDKACSALKPGVTDEEIAACKSTFFKNIAMYMKAGKYPVESRIADYKPYPHPSMQATQNKTSPYSLLDNVTGIHVETGRELVVLVDGLGDKTASIMVQNLDKPGGDGFWGDSYPISDGTNKIKVTNKGLVYLLYHPADWESAPTIKVHFPTGEVNGYFDISKHDASDWKPLLDAAKAKYFDVLGEYAHLTFPTARFRASTEDGAKLIGYFDDIVRSEQELMGLFKYGKAFRNRMHFIVIYTSYMYATSYYTAYNDGTLGELCNPEALSTGSIWGPAHEVGHCNQTRPGLRWLGTTEVTNNIMSEYVQTTVFGQPSRLQVENMGDGIPNRYAKAWRDILVGSAPHSSFGADSDVFCKLVPFWQLQLYFGEVLGKTPDRQGDKGGFYPDVYEYVRTHDDLSTPGEQQTEFVYIASKAAGMNLLDFFTKWGFLTPVDVQLDDYGSGRMTVTQERINAVRSRVESLGLPEPDIALEYISDNNKELFRSRPDIVAGTVSRSDATIVLQNWKNVVVYEVRDAADKLVFASEGVLSPSAKATFTIPGGWKDSYKVYALSATRQRTEVGL